MLGQKRHCIRVAQDWGLQKEDSVLTELTFADILPGQKRGKEYTSQKL